MNRGSGKTNFNCMGHLGFCSYRLSLEILIGKPTMEKKSAGALPEGFIQPKRRKWSFEWGFGGNRKVGTWNLT